MPGILGHMVARNEMGRYLQATLPALAALCHHVVVFDDRSDDQTAEYARLYAEVARRLPSEPSFADNEGLFRQVAWEVFERVAMPLDGEWALSLNADELLIVNSVDTLATVLGDFPHAEALRVPVDEVFGFTPGGQPLIRKDGLWGQRQAVRLARYHPGARFDPRRQGGETVPTSVASMAVPTSELRLLHLGYARAADREARFRRHVNRKGIDRDHLISILTPGILVPFGHPVPPELYDLWEAQ